jgi:hypothetical protein
MSRLLWMKVAGLLALLGADLLIVQNLWPFHHRFATLPLNLAVIAFAVAAVLGLVTGTPRVRFVIVIVLWSLALCFAVFAVQPASMSPMTHEGVDLPALPVVLPALGAAILGVAIAQTIRARSPR